MKKGLIQKLRMYSGHIIALRGIANMSVKRQSRTQTCTLKGYSASTTQRLNEVDKSATQNACQNAFSEIQGSRET